MSDLQAAKLAAFHMLDSYLLCLDTNADVEEAADQIVDAALATLADGKPLYQWIECERPLCSIVKHQVQVWPNEIGDVEEHWIAKNERLLAEERERNE